MYRLLSKRWASVRGGIMMTNKPVLVIVVASRASSLCSHTETKEGVELKISDRIITELGRVVPANNLKTCHSVTTCEPVSTYGGSVRKISEPWLSRRPRPFRTIFIFNYLLNYILSEREQEQFWQTVV
jgi:hypothetical protein